ncbi:tripartite motif-containing protein 2-like [Pecten maximus]|uniref:tripartite motif-containing protein 2-like n=1 Tax=Pecten maximus TaxID=6579 RepID=UPI001458D00D|nr:tripartite motif-containing protein 2-like [Pecten maximus]
MCSGTLRSPKLLPCYHTFCSKCLDDYIERKCTPEEPGSFRCPLCLVLIDIPQDGVSGLPDNLYVLVYDAMNASKNPCQQCDAGSGAVATCVDCNDNICLSCKNVHEKMKATKSHKLVLLVEQEKVLSTSLARQCTCPEHENEEMCFVCKPCNALLCMQCKDSHLDHKLEDAAIAAKVRKEELSRLADGVRAYLPYIKNNIKKADKETERFKKDVNKTKQHILDTADDLKREIDAACARKLKGVDETLDQYLSSIERFRAEMERVYLSIKSLAIISDQIFDLAPDGLLLQTNYNISKRLESVPTEIPACSLESAQTSFEATSLPQGELLGETQVSVLPILNFSPTDKKVPTFYCPGRPYSICPVSDDEAWVICDTSETIQLYSKSGAIRQFLKLPGEANDICCFPNGNLFVTELRGRVIWKIGIDNSVTTFASIDDTVRGICYFVEKFYVTSKDSTRHMVSILTQDTGDVENEIIQDNGNPIFCHPDRLAVTSNGTVCVTDRGKDGAVIFVTLDGHVRSSYRGEGSDKDEGHKERFEPWGLCVDQHDNIFISDRFNDVIHVLDRNGVFQKYLLNKDDGIRRPLGIAVDNAGHIWVGNEDGSIRVFEYLELL